MKNLLEEGGVYVCVRAEKREQGARLDHSILITILRPPAIEDPYFEGEMYWCVRGREAVYIDRTRFFPLSPITVDGNDTFRNGSECVTLAEFESIVCACATFMAKRQAYRALFDLAGRALAKKMLLKAHDVAALQAFVKNSRVLRQFRQGAWSSEIMSGSEEQFAFLAFEKLFNENLQGQALASNITSLSGDLEIEKTTRLHFTADYSEVLGEVQPVNVVIGANGVGKTRLLLAIAEASQRGALSATNEDRVSYSNECVHLSDVVSFTYEPALWTRYRRSGVKVISLGVGAREWKRLTAVIQELTLSEHSNFHIQAYVEVIRTIVDPHYIMVPIANTISSTYLKTIRGRHYIPLVELAKLSRNEIGLIDPTGAIIASSEEIGHHHLSSGQRSLLLFIAQLFLHGERAVILIDEPENHLHPQYITLLMRMLQSALIAMESRAIVITHSPFVVREVDKSAVQILDRDRDSLPCLYQTSLQTFGGDVAQISDYVFGDYEVKKGYQILIQRAIANSSPENRMEVADQVSSSLGDDGELYLQKILND